MITKVKEQENIIKDIYNELKDNSSNSPLVKSALSTLDNMNEMQEFYLNSIINNHDIGERILRLYALLQGLFVGIDSLYALAVYMCGSKSFININQNKVLKEVKYIRNDVVGHPVNRVYDNNQLAYCVLNSNNIKETTISYDIYTNNKKSTKDVDLLECLNNYYIESNELLIYLLEFYKFNSKSNLVSKTKDFYEKFDPNNYNTLELREYYNELYKTNNDKQSRFIWRINLLETFKQKKFKGLKEDLFNYSLKYQVKKLLEIAYLVEGQKIEVDVNYRFPRYLMLLKDFLYTNKFYVDKLDILLDATHPYFISTIESMLDISNKSNNKILSELFDWLLENKDDEKFIYLVSSTFKTIRI